jgi:hypothetical protein
MPGRFVLLEKGLETIDSDGFPCDPGFGLRRPAIWTALDQSGNLISDEKGCD